MERGRFGGKKLFAAAIFIASIIVLAVKLLSSASVQVFVEGNTAVTSQVQGLFTYTDVLALVLSSMLMGGSGLYLLLHDSLGMRAGTALPQPTSVGSTILEERRQRWEETAKTLKKNEQALYKAILDEGVINQSELADKTGLSPSDISRTLYLLESKGLVERKRLGMGNVVLLK